MASKMKAKYNKYWRNEKTIDMLLIIVVLDPCYKLDYVEWCLINSFGVKVDEKLKTELSSCLHSLYNLYQGTDEENQDDILSQPSANCEPDDKPLNILGWWKANDKPQFYGIDLNSHNTSSNFCF
ncbi:hypothetical protein Ahy_A09g042974 [Arachis hypogaea]|uniref:hAT-like transposase RNase-H fold domain-containing protein n=1 Tax=Arachis hypogaea TaxID=3818 RepID=A0A445BH71_ARAHY|nr:hypothetical protein Ahy_A09g042974 [Arachis hypogaea]